MSCVERRSDSTSSLVPEMVRLLELFWAKTKNCPPADFSCSRFGDPTDYISVVKREGFYFIFLNVSVLKNWHGLSGDGEYPAQERQEKGRALKLYFRLQVEIQTESSKGL